MLEIFFAIFMALSCPSHSQPNQDGTVTTQETGGDKGQYPPPPPPPTIP